MTSRDFDIAALMRSSAAVAVHNVRLVDVRPGEGAFVLMTIEHNGVTTELVGAGSWSEEHSRSNVGKFGYVLPAMRLVGRDEHLPRGVCYFRDYIDQSLRRAPELDSPEAGSAEPIGWRCDAQPQGFRAPVGLIPGEHGRFVSDQTELVSLRVPPEFVRECVRVQMTPEQLLRSFVGDVSDIYHPMSIPRADGYSSNGSDEREYAQAWLERAHGMHAIDLDKLDARKAQEDEEQNQRDSFADLLSEFVGYGGKVEDLLEAVEALVEKQAEAEKRDE